MALQNHTEEFCFMDIFPWASSCSTFCSSCSVRSTLRIQCFLHIIPLFCIYFSFPVLREVTTKPLNIRDLPVPSGTVSLVHDGAAQGMKDAVGTQRTVSLGGDAGCLEFTPPKRNGLFRERTDPGSFLSLQDSLQPTEDMTDIPLPSSQCSLEFDKLRENLPLPHFDLTSDLT